MNAKVRADCVRKITYSTRKKAINAEMRMRDTHLFVLAQKPYQCPCCLQWHLTKANEWRATG